MSADTATIPAGASVSASIDLRNGALVALDTPVALTGNVLTFLASDDGLTFYDLYIDGQPYAEPAGINQRIGFDRGEFSGVNFLRIRSGTALSPSVQTSDATFNLIGVIPVVEPSPMRTINIERIGIIKAFPPFSPLEVGAVTFNWSRKLAPNETITEVKSFALTVMGPAGSTDPTPSTRILGIASIQGGQVSQRFGNWQQGIGPIWYLVEAVAETSLSNTLVADGIIPVGVPADWCWADYCGC